MSGLAWLMLVGAGFTFLLSKCYFMAPYRLGWLLLIPNVAYETLERRLYVPRAVQDFALLFLALLGARPLTGR